MTSFLIFGFNRRPDGGTSDLRYVQFTLEDARRTASHLDFRFYQIYDCQAHTTVEQGTVVGLLASRQEPGSSDD